MDDDFSRVLRTRRTILGLTQRALAGRSGVAQPQIAAIESGRRAASPVVRAALDEVLRVRPSQALDACRREVLAAVERAGARDATVFGSVARGDDGPDSDLDLIVTFPPGTGITAALALEEDLSWLLTVPVEVVSSGSSGLAHLSGPRVPVVA